MPVKWVEAYSSMVSVKVIKPVKYEETVSMGTTLTVLRP